MRCYHIWLVSMETHFSLNHRGICFLVRYLSQKRSVLLLYKANCVSWINICFLYLSILVQNRCLLWCTLCNAKPFSITHKAHISLNYQRISIVYQNLPWLTMFISIKIVIKVHKYGTLISFGLTMPQRVGVVCTHDLVLSLLEL